MLKTYFLLIPLLMLSFNISQAQRSGGGGSITGKVLDYHDNQPLEYANVIIFDSLSNAMVSGSATNAEGMFTVSPLRPGRYFAEVKFIGYEKEIIQSLQIRNGRTKIDLGEVLLKRASYEIDGVQVMGEKISMEYKIDKKVINVAQQNTVLSGTAIDVLEASPSITVDIEGNVILRGSSDFTVLIDGKPSVLDANDALEQIPASTIESIEIITNPSAKYDPEGTSGIINIVSKKNSLDGFNGIVNLNVGLDDKYGGDFLFNYRTNGFNIYLGADYNERNYPGTRDMYTETQFGSSTNYLETSGDMDRSRKSYGFRGGFSYDISPNDMISIGGRYGSRDSDRNSALSFREWNEPAGDEFLYTSSELSSRMGDFYALNFDYTHKFSKDGHQLVLQGFYSKRDMDEDGLTELFNTHGTIANGQKAIEGGPEDRIRIKLDYKLPINETNYIEAGYQSELREENGFNDSFQYDVLTNEYIFEPEFSHENIYTKNIHSLYSTYTGEVNGFGYQAGLRGEYTYRVMELTGVNEEFKIDRFDLFPSLHFSYSLDEQSQMMASYSRRIVRPRDFFLEPFLTWIDAYNIRQGNPSLEPQYIDSFEAGFQKHMACGSFSAEGYYRITHNKIERVRSVYSENVMLHKSENVGKSYALGAELMFATSPFAWWNISLMGNLYDYRQEGYVNGLDYSSDSFNWNARFNNQFKISQATRVQFDFRFNSPSVTSQGRREGMYMLSGSIKQEIIAKTLSATLQVRDILGTAKREFSAEGPTFYSNIEMTRNAPIVMLTLSYNINNYKKEMKRDSEDMDDGESDF